MSTASKTFHMSSVDTLYWASTPGHANSKMSYRDAYRKGADGHRQRTYGITQGGCLRNCVKHTPSTTSNYWELSTTWEALGIPAGQPVTAVQLEYEYRWDFSRTWSYSDPGTNTTGPAELRDSGGSLLASLTSVITCPVASRGGQSTGAKESHYPSKAGQPQTGLKTTDRNWGWGISTGSTVAVPSGSQASNTAIRLRLNNTMQATANTSVPDYMRLRQDRIVVTATYGATALRRRVFVS